MPNLILEGDGHENEAGYLLVCRLDDIFQGWIAFDYLSLQHCAYVRHHGMVDSLQFISVLEIE